MAKGILAVNAAAVEGRDEDFNDWYTNVHVVDILKIAGFTSARRFKAIDPNHATPYLTIYEVEADDLQAAVAGIGAAAQSGEMAMSDAVAMDPAPVLALYEQI